MNKTVNEKTIPSYMIGTWAWGKGINGSKMIFGKTYSQEQLMETFSTAYKAGFTFWDTAEVYGMGNAEKILGQCIAGNITNREDILISTKHLPGKKYKKGAVTAAINGSLQRMGIDTISQPLAAIKLKNKRIILFVDARAIMHIYGICVPIHRELNSPASIHTKG